MPIWAAGHIRISGTPPKNIKLDPRLRVLISFNNQCWRHKITDPTCAVNAELVKIMTEWRKLGMPLVFNRDEISANGSVGSTYIPAERVLYENFHDYTALGFTGTQFCVVGPFPPELSYEKDRVPYYGKNFKWFAMWQTCYLAAQFMWDINQDFDALYEEANSLYYGKAWEGGFKSFRKLLGRANTETPGCIGWGQGAPLGKCLDQAGMEQRLNALLEQAIAAAKNDPDPRALAHVLRDKEIFTMTWLTERKLYLETYKEYTAYKRTTPITIDGNLDDEAWKGADSYSNFKAFQPGKSQRGLPRNFLQGTL